MDETNPTPSRHFGARVEALIKARGLVLDDIVEQTGIPKTTLHRRLKSPHMSFNLGELSQVAEVLGTTAGAIVTEWEAAA
jgi:predicted transcriptional regulator